MKFVDDLLLTAAIFVMSFQQAGAQQPATIKGKVTDLETGEALVAANVRILGIPKGTITNIQGEYRLRLEPASYSFVFSTLGYQPDTLSITLSRDTTFDIRLKQSPIQIAPVVVLAEDPALEIIRKAIANKKRWMSQLHSYKFDAFTRQVLRRDSLIASISESYSTGYAASGDTLREVVTQKRQTENIHLEENFASVGRILNFNDDEIRLLTTSAGGNSSSYVFVGPTAPDALDNYDFKLLGTSSLNGVDLFTIRMTPKSKIKPLFTGTIIIADQTFAVMGVDVRPNETLVFPFVKEISLRYRQKFSLCDTIFWMPTDIRIDGSFSIRFVGFSLPRIGFQQMSSIYGYEVNVPIPDSLRSRKRLTVDSSAAKFDSTFWQANDVLPLTAEEADAYASIDSSQTLDKQFKPRGALAAFSDDATGGIFKTVDARFNRAEGFYFGAHFTIDSLVPSASIRLSGGYGFSDDRPKYNVGATWYPLQTKTLGLGGDVFQALNNTPDRNPYGTFPLSLFALVDKNDYRDYFFSAGWKASAEVSPSNELFGSLTYLYEQEYSMPNATDYSLFARQEAFRINPPITEGLMKSIQFDFRWGDEAVPFDFLSRNAVELAIERSSPSLTGGEFDFARYNAIMQWNIHTFGTNLLFPPTLRIDVAAGTSGGTLPPQRIFTLDSRIGIFAPYGVLRGSEIKEFTGDRYVVVHVEHNFRSIPFVLLDIPSFYNNGIEFIIHGAVAQTWIGGTTTSNGWYYEAGFGVSRILDLLRADLNYRLSNPSHLNFTITAATFF